MQNVQEGVSGEYLAKLGRHLAHELNNPISAISSSAYLLRDFMEHSEDGKVDNELMAPFVESISEECGRMKSVVEEFARLVTLDSILPTPIRLEEFVRSRINDVAGEGLEVVLTTEIPEDHVIHADASNLQYIMNTLFGHARATGVKKLQLNVVSLDEGSDSRCRMQFDLPRQTELSPEDIENLFSGLPVKKARGSGLQFPLASRIVKLHHGRIWAEQTPENGLRFNLELPCSQPI